MKYTPTGIDPARKSKPDFDEWERSVEGHEAERRLGGFWRADLMLLGVMWYGDDAVAAIFDPHAWSEQAIKTWQNALSIGRHIPPTWWLELDPETAGQPSRRRAWTPYSTYSHHCEVAYLKPEDFAEESPSLAKLSTEELQDRYLQLSIDNQLSVRKLRDLIREDQGRTGEEVKFDKRPLGEFLYDEAEKIRNRLEEAEGAVKEKMLTAVFALDDAAEIQKDGDAMNADPQMRIPVEEAAPA
jgi:hypothetical protein